MRVIRSSKAEIVPKDAQRIFLCAAAQDSEERDAFIEDVLLSRAEADRVVSYRVHDDKVDETALKTELLQSGVLVLLVTTELICMVVANGLPIEFRIARDNLVSILPIVTDEGMLERFNELFGSIHSIVATDARYKDKLKVQLDGFLVSRSWRKETIKEAFLATAFLSYRKVDVDDALRLMRSLHDIKCLEPLSIWYDSFLTGGEEFDFEIELQIRKCNVFLLAVTPNILEEKNYVQTVEYPLACKLGKVIVPIEIVPTDQNRFVELFPGAGIPIPMDEADVLGEKLSQVFRRNQYSVFHLGEAYRNGIGVEKDFGRAVCLHEAAAMQGELGAIDVLIRIYQFGFDTDIDYKKALFWAQKYLEVCLDLYGEDHVGTLNAYGRIAYIYDAVGNYDKALEYFQKSAVSHDNFCDEMDYEGTAHLYLKLAELYSIREEFEMANKLYHAALKIHKMLAREKKMAKKCCTVGRVFNGIALLYKRQGKLSKAMKWYRKAIHILRSVFGERHGEVAVVYYNIGSLYSQKDKVQKARDWYHKSIQIYFEAGMVNHPQLATVYGAVAANCRSLGDYEQALQYYFKAQAITEKFFGIEHEQTAAIYSGIALTYAEKDEMQTALEWHLKALAAMEKVENACQKSMITICQNIATCYDALEDYAASVAWCKREASICQEVYGNAHPETASAYYDLAEGYEQMGDLENAFDFYVCAYMFIWKSIGLRNQYASKTAVKLLDVHMAGNGTDEEFAVRLQEKLIEVSQRFEIAL